MITFFKKIRQQLLSKNKFSKYLTYAIGEIILVVIGILIALTINNWNEKQKELAQEQLILKQLHREYTNNLDQLNEKIFMRNEGLLASKTILNFIDHPESIDVNELYNPFLEITRDPTFNPIVNDIISTEKLRILQNSELVTLLSNWSTEVFQVQELELEYQKFRTEIIIPCLARLGLLRNINNAIWKDGYIPTEALDKENNAIFHIHPTKKNIDLNKVFSDVELEGLLSQVITFHLVTNLQSNSLKERILEIISLIEKDISS